MNMTTEVPRYRHVKVPGSGTNVVLDHNEPRTVRVRMANGFLYVPIENMDWRSGNHEVFPFKMRVAGQPAVERGQDNSGGWWTTVTVQGTKRAYNQYRGYVMTEEVSFKQWDHSPDEVWIDVHYAIRPYRGEEDRMELSGVLAKGARLDEVGEMLGVQVETPNTPHEKVGPRSESTRVLRRQRAMTWGRGSQVAPRLTR